MRRRDFLGLVGGVVTLPLAAGAQQVVPVIGWLSVRSPEHDRDWFGAFQQGLRDGGFVEEENVRFASRWAADRNERLRVLADELVSQQVAVIVAASGTPVALAAKEATTTIPVVFLISADPVRAGLVASINRPGGNVTGIGGFTDAIITKRLELLSELTPGDAAIGVLLNSNNQNLPNRISDVAAAAARLGRDVRVIQVGDIEELEERLSTAVATKIRGLVVQNDTLFLNNAQKLAALALRVQLPMIFEERENVQAGGLMSYGASRSERLRKLGIYTALILKGANPGTLPVDQPTEFELIVNLKTAKALGLTLPPSLLARANEVIE